MADFSIDQERLPGVKEGKFGFMQPASERANVNVRYESPDILYFLSYLYQCDQAIFSVDLSASDDNVTVV